MRRPVLVLIALVVTALAAGSTSYAGASTSYAGASRRTPAPRRTRRGRTVSRGSPWRAA